MKKPEKKETVLPQMAAFVEQQNIGYNQACDDWEKWLATPEPVWKGTSSTLPSEEEITELKKKIKKLLKRNICTSDNPCLSVAKDK